jgi:hypothetical protein
VVNKSTTLCFRSRSLSLFPIAYHLIPWYSKHFGRNSQSLNSSSNNGNGPDVAPCSAYVQVAGFGGFAVLIFGVNSVGLAMLAFKALVTPATDTTKGD